MNDIKDWQRYYGEERVKRAELEVATDELVEAAEMVLACIDQPRSRDNSEHAGIDAAEALRKATAEVKEFNSATLQCVHGLAAGDLPMVGDLAMLVARLARKLRKAAPADELPAQALDYLNRNGLKGSPLREVGAGETAVTREMTNAAIDVMLKKGDVILSADFVARLYMAMDAVRHNIGVNVSALTVALAPDAYLMEIEALAAEAERVIVEITETFPIPDLAALVYFARRCEEVGVFVALDDCTPNHDFCSPVVVQRVRPHILKIDGVLFNDCFNHGTVKPLVEIIKLATSIGAETVAEHIATRDMRDLASRLGVGLLQGYYFGEATPLTLAMSSDQPRAADCCA